tara:strand:- start:7417 stop:7956 length:540 start_codon:yes stop_codon:yes gene_type:complete
MISSKAAKRYAKALLTLSQEQGSLEEVLEDINIIHDTIKGSRDLQVTLKSPIAKPSDKTIILDEIFSKHIGTLAMQFILLVAEKERSALLPYITEAFFSLYNEAVGITKVTLKSAYPLEAAQLDSISKALEFSTKKNVHLHVEVVPSLLGGITIQMEDTVIDGSVLHKLNELEHTLLSQ